MRRFKGGLSAGNAVTDAAGRDRVADLVSAFHEFREIVTFP
jgi:hypothetical protein